MRHLDSWSFVTVRRTTDLTPTVREFELVPEAGAATAFSPGSHLNVRVQIGTRQETRSYSLVGNQPHDGAWRIAVKRLDPGRGGSRYMWSLRPGARLAVSPAANHFELDLGAPEYLLVAGGIGVTPLVGMAQLLAARGARVQMCYAARRPQEFACLDALRSALGANLRVFASSEDARIDFESEFAALSHAAQVYLCGPVSMMDAARRAWSAAGRPASNLRFETFGSSGRFAAQAFRVKLPRHRCEIEVAADTTLLDALEAAGIEVLSDCRRGECGLCMMNVLSVQGSIDHRDVFLSEHEQAQGQRICACVSRVAGPGASIALDSAYRDDTLAA